MVEGVTVRSTRVAPGVFVAAGHGGEDAGASAGGLVERDLNAAVAEALVAALRLHGLRVATDLEHGNPSFPEEADLAAAWPGVTYYLALHHNAHDSSARGAEAFGAAGPGAALATALHDATVDVLRALDPRFPDRGVQVGDRTRAAKHLARAPGTVAVLEPCFLTSPEDRHLCRHPDYVDLLASALCRAVIDHGRVDGLWAARYRPGRVPLPPVFSVIIPTHNRPGLLAEAVSSVLDQSVTGVEVLVSDDGSVPAVSAFGDPRVQVLRRPTAAGPAGARNRALTAARGRFVAFLDDDDRWTTDRLDLALAGLRRAPVAVCWTRHLDRPEQDHRVLEGFVGDNILDGTTPCLGATALRRAVTPTFDERWLAIEDVDWWWRLALEQPIATVPEVGYLVRLHAGERGRNDLHQRVAENLELLAERRAFFGTHRRAAAHRWLRTGVLATQDGDHRTAVAAFARVARLDPGVRSAGRLTRSLGRLARAAAERHRVGP